MQVEFVYLVVFLAIAGLYLLRKRGFEHRSRAAWQAAVDAGMTQPPSLHPVLDASRCVGCGGCVKACPEGNVLGLIGGKAELINPANCIGHGACRTACPMQAINLVFGTAERGVELPAVNANFETNMPGIFIAGELGGMGLIRNAVEQGRQAMQSIIDSLTPGSDAGLDVVIVGAGPAGLSASLAAREAGLTYKTLEQDELGGTIAHFPRGKLVMTAPVDLPGGKKMNFTEVSREELLDFWTGLVDRSDLNISYRQRLTAVEPLESGYRVKTETGSFDTRAVLLALGRRGTPRKLGVPGEELSKVIYSLRDPEACVNQRVLVVGGGDSALEAAASIAEIGRHPVTISYRSGSFSRAKEKNRQRVEALVDAGKLRLELNTTVKCIEPDRVVLNAGDDQLDIANDLIIVCAGGILPTPLLRDAGIEIETHYGTS